MMSWLSNEIKILNERTQPNEYYERCLKSASKAYKSLLKDGPSGASISIIKEIFDRLIDGLPLTEITEEDFKAKPKINMPQGYLSKNNLKSEVQCNRYTSLFRTEDLNGNVTYTDIGRYYCINSKHPELAFSSGLACNVLDKMFPISLPYYPSSKKYVIHCDEFLFDPTMGDFDTVGFFDVITPDGNKKEIHRYFKEIRTGELTKLSDIIQGSNSDRVITQTAWVEITVDEYKERYSKKTHD